MTWETQPAESSKFNQIVGFQTGLEFAPGGRPLAGSVIHLIHCWVQFATVSLRISAGHWCVVFFFLSCVCPILTCR